MGKSGAFSAARQLMDLVGCYYALLAVVMLSGITMQNTKSKLSEGFRYCRIAMGSTLAMVLSLAITTIFFLISMMSAMTRRGK